MPLVPERTVVISLERRGDRRAGFFERWRASGWGAFLPEPEVFTAVDGFAGVDAACVPAHLRAEPGAYGCWASHVAVLRAALDDGLDAVGVFEDDVSMAEGSAVWLREVLAGLPQGAEALWLDASRLGSGNRLLPGSFGTRRLLRPPMRTHAYIASRAVIGRWLPHLEAGPAHIDRHLAWAPVRPMVFAAVPALATQLADALETADSDTGARLTPLSAEERLQRHGSKDALRLRRLSPRA